MYDTVGKLYGAESVLCTDSTFYVPLLEERELSHGSRSCCWLDKKQNIHHPLEIAVKSRVRRVDADFLQAITKMDSLSDFFAKYVKRLQDRYNVHYFFEFCDVPVGEVAIHKMQSLSFFAKI